MITANYHTHSTLCDGTSTLREHVERAIELGFTQLGFSGHMDADVHMDYLRYKKEVRHLQTEYDGKLEILCGIELDNLYQPEYAESADYVIGSTHFLKARYERPLSIDDTPEDCLFLLNTFYQGDWLKMCKAYYELEAEICNRFSCTFIGHFDLITKFNHILHFIDEEDPKYLSVAAEAMEALVRKQIPFEINTKQAHRGKLFPGGRLLQTLHDLGGEIIISSDAHHCSELNRGFDYAVLEAKKCGFTHTNYLTLKSGRTEFVQKAL